MTYRLVFADNQHVSPCPDEVWETFDLALEGVEYWEKQTGRTMKLVEDQPVRPVEKGSA
jgi:hypothetical protein